MACSRRHLAAIIMYVWHHGEICRVELINCWTVKHRISVAKRSFPGPRGCTPRNRVAVVRTLPRGASPLSVPVAVSCSSSSSSSLPPCSEVSLREFWIWRESKSANLKKKTIKHLQNS